MTPSPTVSPEALRKMAAYQRRLDRQRAEALWNQVRAARKEVERLTEAFRECDPGIRKIVLFGSLARDDVCSAGFDIDLAVDCSRDAFLELVKVALDSPLDVDSWWICQLPTNAFEHR